MPNTNPPPGGGGGGGRDENPGRGGGDTGFFGLGAQPFQPAAATGGMHAGAIVINISNPQFNDRRSIEELTNRIGKEVMRQLTMQMRFAY